jgi:hypothetical protein
MQSSRILNKLWQAISFCCLILVLFAGPIQGEPRYDMHNDQVPYNSIEFDGVLENTYAQSAEEGVKVLINDTLYSLLPDAIFRNRHGSLVGISSFQAGMLVGFYLLGTNQIAKMWEKVGEEPSEEPAQVRPRSGGRSSSSESGDEIRLEDGVWRN